MSVALRLLLVLALVLAPCAHAEEAPSAPDWQAIKRVIGEQLMALRQDDGARAFAFAAPGLQAQFGNAETFMQMVHAGYQSLIDARYDEFLEGAVIEGRVIQPLRITSRDETVQVALYTMDRDETGRWRIAGCLLAPSTSRLRTAAARSRPAGAQL
ncbi:MAG: DUF4864 domain-containing protein [Betaproteobacteria bacterium]